MVEIYSNLDPGIHAQTTYSTDPDGLSVSVRIVVWFRSLLLTVLSKVQASRKAAIVVK